MTKKTNGSGNGHDKDADEKIVRFPTLAERDRIAREERKAEAKRMKARRASNDVPFLNLSKITPFVRVLILAIIAVHLIVFLFLSYPMRHEAFMALGFVPADFTNDLTNMPWYAPLNLASHTLIHGSWMHLIFNGVMAMALGILFERNFGTRRAVIFFFACAAAGALAHLAINPFSTAPVIGASGGISGFFAAAILFLSERGQMGNLGRKGPWPVLGFWLAFMIIVGLISGGETAWLAHIGGFIAGGGIYYLLRTGRINF